jgi:integrase
VDAIFATAASDPTIFGVRDAAVIALLGDAGLEDHELTRLEMRDFEAVSGCVRLAREGEIVCVPLSARAVEAVERWVQLRGRSPGQLLHPLERSATIVRKRISRVLVHDVVRRRSRAAGVKIATPGDLSRAHGPGFRCPAAALFLSRHGRTMRTALTKRLDSLAGLLSGGALNAQSYNWMGLAAEQLGRTTIPEDISQRQLNEMLTALCGVLREGLNSGAMRPEAYESIQRQVSAAARRRA